MSGLDRSLAASPRKVWDRKNIKDQIIKFQFAAEQADIVLSFLEQITTALWEVHEHQLIDLVLRDTPPREDDIDLYPDGQDW